MQDDRPTTDTLFPDDAARHIATEIFLAVYAIELICMAQNLNTADLSGARLRGTNLTGVDWRNANLINADFSGANLRGADLRGANRTVAIGL